VHRRPGGISSRGRAKRPKNKKAFWVSPQKAVFAKKIGSYRGASLGFRPERSLAGQETPASLMLFRFIDNIAKFSLS